MPISEMDNPAPYETTFQRISKSEHFVDRVKDLSSGFQSKVDPASTLSLAAFRTRTADGTVSGNSQVYYSGYLHQHRTRHLGIVNELLEEHDRAAKETEKTGKFNAPMLSVVDQQQKIEDLQKALIEEAAFLERMKYYEVEPENTCPTMCGEGKAIPFLRCHKMVSYDCNDVGVVCCGHYHDCTK